MSITNKKFILYSIIIFITLLIIKTLNLIQDLQEYKLSQHQQSKRYLKSNIYAINKISNALFDNLINQPTVLNIFKDAHHLDKQQKAHIRTKLYHLLDKRYRLFKSYDIQQLHFHLPNSESFLRFHAPNYHGDSLKGIRKTVDFVNRFQKPISGFEEGRIFNGFRFVYPLFYQTKHIGSVEVSSSLLSFKRLIEQDRDSLIDFILHKDILDQKLFASHRSNYLPYPIHPNFFTQTILVQYDKRNGTHTLKKSLLQTLRRDSTVQKKLDNFEEFTTIQYHQGSFYIVTFLSLKNALDNTQVGYSIDIAKSTFIYDLIKNFILNTLFLLIVSLSIGYLLNKEIHFKNRFKQLYNQYKTILDLSSNIVMIFKENKIIEANDKFLEFFNIHHLDQFIYHHTPYKIFYQNNGFFYPLNQQRFIQELRSLPDAKTYVSMLDRHNHPKIFELFVHTIGDSPLITIIELIDITSMKLENLELKNLVYKDQLTSLYNRYYLLHECSNLKKQYEHLSMVMFDIDHFKEVNDTYGHLVGDDTLKFLAQSVQKSLDTQSVLIRWGGEEFLILIPKALDSIKEYIEAIRSTLYETSLASETIPTFSCSFGAIEIQKSESLTQAIARVDKLLYQAKILGRDRVVYAN
jgi:diguanylate cyclase (GGDEF)-like protein